jgi:hypothetical protein
MAYQGDPIWWRPANLTTAQRDAKLATFLVYAAHDPLVCQTADACLANRSYAPWFSREYRIGDEVGGGQNVAGLATVTASSQNTSTGQTAVKAVDGVVTGNWTGTTHEWATVHGRAGSWINLTWRSPRRLARIVLYDRPNPVDRVTGGTLRFSDGTTVVTGALPNDGTAHIVEFSPRSVRSLRFTVTSVAHGTRNVGLAELQAYTDNVAPLAQVTASSQNTTTKQQAVKAVDGVVVGNPIGSTHEWATVHGRAGSWLQLDWRGPQSVNRVVLYDRPNLVDQVAGGTLTFSDGTTLPVPALPNNGSGQVISFPARTVTSLRFTVTSVGPKTQNIGLAEIEVESPQPFQEAR